VGNDVLLVWKHRVHAWSEHIKYWAPASAKDLHTTMSTLHNMFVSFVTNKLETKSLRVRVSQQYRWRQHESGSRMHSHSNNNFYLHLRAGLRCSVSYSGSVLPARETPTRFRAQGPAGRALPQGEASCRAFAGRICQTKSILYISKRKLLTMAGVDEALCDAVSCVRCVIDSKK
jgi:hypothetical protein